MFDLNTSVRDKKTGRIIKMNAYRLHCSKLGKLFERPINSGNLYYENGEPAGQYDYSAKKGEEIKIGAAHVEWRAPLTKDQMALNYIKDLENKVADLEAVQIKKEADAKVKAEAEVKVLSAAPKKSEKAVVKDV